MLTCLALTVLVALPQPMTGTVKHEWHNHRWCERGQVTDVPLPMQPLTHCENAAHYYIESLQQGGILPGSRHVISYRITCTTEI